ncbi:MAG: putative quinol monooxygenase [Caulobacterales bacterium]
MIIIAGTLKIAPGLSREDVAEQFGAGIVATRQEPGCLAYSFSIDILDETVVHIYEVYKDAAAVAEHRANLAARRNSATPPKVRVLERDVSEFEIVNERKI